MGRAQLQRELARRHPGLDAEAVAFCVSYWVPWVQPPPRGRWRDAGAAVMTTVDSWLGPGPVRDVQAWCGLTKLRDVVEGMGRELRRFRGDDGAELFDVPGLPLPDP